MKKKKTYLIYFNLFVFIASISLSLAIGEIIARVFHLSKTYDSYPWQVYQVSQHINYYPERNSYGWRDREYSRNKKIGTFRIACIGDSITAGYRVKLQNTFPKLLESSFKQMGQNVEVMNLGISGNATEENLLMVKKAMEFQPDLIIYQFGLNDIKNFEYYKQTMQGNDLSVEKEFNFKQLFRHSALYLALAERYNYFKLKMGYKNWSFDSWNANDEIWEKEFIKFKNILTKINNSTKIIILNMPYDFQVYSNKTEVYIPSKKIGKFCQDNGYGFLDFSYIFKRQKQEYDIFLDDCHLTDRGHEIVTEYLKKFILRHYLAKE